MFDRWRRRKSVAEAENYIKATDNVSRPVAILLSLAAIIIIAAIIFGLFLAGRWVYNKITDDGQQATEQTENGDTTSDEQLEFPGFTEGEDDNSEETGDQSTGDSSTAVPNTGPEVIPDTGPGTTE